MGGINWTAPADGASGAATESLKDYIQGGHEPLAPARKKKKRGGAKKQDDELATGTDGINGLEALLHDEPVELHANGNGDAHSDDHEGKSPPKQLSLPNANNSQSDRDKVPAFDTNEDGGPVQPRPPRNRMTTSEFSDISDSMPVSMDQLTNGAKAPPPPSDPNRVPLETWLANQTGHAYECISEIHRSKIVDHLLNHKHAGSTPNWPAAIRQYIWRAAIRSNFFWIDPETGQPTGKPKPIHRPDGVYESDFRVFVMCAAERLDRVGRDLPTEEYVKDVEAQVRVFLGRAEKGFNNELRYLAFLLLWDEEQKRDLKVEDMAERVKRAFGKTRMRSDGCEILVPKEGKQQKKGFQKGQGHSVYLDYAEAVWEDAKKVP